MGFFGKGKKKSESKEIDTEGLKKELITINSDQLTQKFSDALDRLRDLKEENGTLKGDLKNSIPAIDHNNYMNAKDNKIKKVRKNRNFFAFFAITEAFYIAYSFGLFELLG